MIRMQKNFLMKTISLLFWLALSNPAKVFAQRLSDLGDISPEEIAMKQCDFDKEAATVILLHEAISEYDEQYHLVTTHHVRIKILKESGIDAGNVSIPFYRKDNFEEIDKVEGLTINIGTDGAVTKDKLDKKSVYTKQTNERYGEVVFAFPSVKAGSFIDYKYRSTMKNYGGLESWEFQDEAPVVLSKYLLHILPRTEFAYRVNKKSDMDVLIKPDSENGKIYFEMKHIAGLKKEPFMDARKDYIQKVIFQLSGYNGSGFDKKNYMTSWDEVNNELWNSEDFGVQLRKNVQAEDLFNSLRALITPEEKMKAVYDFVRFSVNWDGVHSSFAEVGIKDLLKKGKGASGSINLLLVNLLNEAGLDAYPMLVSERYHGKVSTDYPFIGQFNTVYACVVINSKYYYLDAVDKICPSHITPYDILNTTAFLVKKKGGQLLNITNDSLQYREVTTAILVINDSGMVSGNINVSSRDYARIDKMEKYKADKDKFKDHYFPSEGLSLNISKVDIKNLENDSLPLEQQFEFKSLLHSSGDYLYLPLNLFPGLKTNPFLSENRFSDINFGYKKNMSVTASITLPAGYTVDDLPKSIKMITPDNDILFQRQISYDAASRTVSCMMHLEFKNSLYTVDQYPVLKEVYKRLFDYFKEPILLKKK